MKTIMTTFKLYAILMIIVGVIYPVAVTVFAQLIFPKEAGGSLLHDSGGNLTGSALSVSLFQTQNTSGRVHQPLQVIHIIQWLPEAQISDQQIRIY